MGDNNSASSENNYNSDGVLIDGVLILMACFCMTKIPALHRTSPCPWLVLARWTNRYVWDATVVLLVMKSI